MFHRLRAKKLIYLVSEDWYFWSHRLPLARAAQAAGAKVTVAARPNSHVDRIKEEGFGFAPIPFDRTGLHPARDARALTAIARLYRRLRPDLVHHVAAKPVILGSLASQISRVPVTVNAMAGMGFMFTRDTVKARFARWIFGTALSSIARREDAWMIVQNNDDETLLRGFGFVPERLHIIRGSGVDTRRFCPAEARTANDPLVAVCVSRMLWDKGIGELVEAAALLRQRGVSLRVRLVGGTDVNPSSVPQATLDRWQADGVVEVLGPRDDIAAIYHGADIAVLPSYREGLPKSLLEAAACGLPLVSTDVTGCREVCRHMETGLLVPARDPRALADALATLAEVGALRTRLGLSASKLVLNELSEEHVAARTLDLYKRAFEQHG